MNQINLQDILQAPLELQLSLPRFIFHLLLTALLGYLLSVVYARFGTSLSNRKSFGRNFVILAMTTMVVISIVKSSLMLSLGLVGALSIVRFRSAIKEPEELAYVFLAIAIGLGLGAEQTVITTVAFVVIAAVIIVARLLSRDRVQARSMFLNLRSGAGVDVSLDDMIRVIRERAPAASLKRADLNGAGIEASFLLEFDNPEQLTKTQAALRDLDAGMEITYLDNRSVV